MFVLRKRWVRKSSSCVLLSSPRSFDVVVALSLAALRCLLRRHLDAAGLAVGLARVDLLASLGNGAQDGLVGEGGVGNDGRGLALEGDLVALDA